MIISFFASIHLSQAHKRIYEVFCVNLSNPGQKVTLTSSSSKAITKSSYTVNYGSEKYMEKISNRVPIISFLDKHSVSGKKCTQRYQSSIGSRLSVKRKTVSLKTIRQGKTYTYYVHSNYLGFEYSVYLWTPHSAIYIYIS